MNSDRLTWSATKFAVDAYLREGRVKLYEGKRWAGKLESYKAQLKIVHKDKGG